MSRPVYDLDRSESVRLGLLPFPGLRSLPGDVFGDALIFSMPRLPKTLREYDITIFMFFSAEADWPIRPDVAASVASFRRSLSLSQVAFAEALGVARVSVERWENGRIRPFRGHALALLTALRPLVTGATSAGQLLNIAAAAVCPRMTRPTGRYTYAEIEALLRDGKHDHRVLAKPLLHAMVESVILRRDSHYDDTFVPAVGLAMLERDPPDPEVLAVAKGLTPADRHLWLSVGRRLAASSESAPG